MQGSYLEECKYKLKPSGTKDIRMQKHPMMSNRKAKGYERAVKIVTEKEQQTRMQ